MSRSDIRKASPEHVAATGLQYRYVLSADKRAPAIFLVHGRAGDSTRMWTFRRCLPDNCSFFAPQAPYPDTLGGYSWWSVDHKQAAGKAQEAARLLRTFVERVLKVHDLKPKTMLALGFSQGAGVLSVIAQSEPTIFQGIALLAGFVAEIGAGTISDSSSTKPIIFVAHGLRDETVPIDKVRQDVNYLRSRGFQVQFVTDEVGHKVGPSALKELTNWCKGLVSKWEIRRKI